MYPRVDISSRIKELLPKPDSFEAFQKATMIRLISEVAKKGQSAESIYERVHKNRNWLDQAKGINVLETMYDAAEGQTVDQRI